MTNIGNTALLKQSKIVVPEGGDEQPLEKLKAIQLDLSQLGYAFDGDVFNALKKLSDDEIASFYSFVVSQLKEMVGAHVDYTPLYVNFPHELPDDFSYLINRIIGHIQTCFNLDIPESSILSCGHIIDPKLFDVASFGACPICQRQTEDLTNNRSSKHVPLQDVTPLKLISRATEDDFWSLFNNLASSNVPLSDEDLSLLAETIRACPVESFFKLTFETISQKEILATVISEFLKSNSIHEADLCVYIKTFTDILRIASYLSGGDVSLKENTLFKLKNKERHFIMRALNNVVIHNIETGHSYLNEDDLLRNKSRWKKLAFQLHIGTYKTKYPDVFSLFHTLRNHEKLLCSSNGFIEEAIKYISMTATVEDITLDDFPLLHKFFNNSKKDVKNTIIDELITTLKKNPGIFGRYLDAVIRHAGDKQEQVIKEFSEIISHITTPNLLKMQAHFKTRNVKADYRYYIPKGSIAKIKVDDDNRKLIPHNINMELIELFAKEIGYRFGKQTPMGKVFIDPILKNYVLPFSQRGGKKQLDTIPRGSRVSFDPKTKVIRLFLYWKESGTSGRVDVDLSAVSYKEDWSYHSHVSYTRLSSASAKHSGDIQSAPNGASEFIDLDIDTFLANDVRYIAATVYSFTGQKFADFQAFAGLMERQEILSGQPYEPTTIKNKFDISGNSVNNVPFIIDLKERQIIWGDLDLSGAAINNVESNLNGLQSITRITSEMRDNLPSLYDLLMLHVSQRAQQVDFVYNKNENYDYIFDEGFSRKIDEISSVWLK